MFICTIIFKILICQGFELNYNYLKKCISDIVYICDRKIDPTHNGTLSKMSVEEWKQIIEKCIATNGNSNHYCKLNTVFKFLSELILSYVL